MENGIVSCFIDVVPLTGSSCLALLPFPGRSQGRAEAGTGTAGAEEEVFGFGGMVQGELWNSVSVFGHYVVLALCAWGCCNTVGSASSLMPFSVTLTTTSCMHNIAKKEMRQGCQLTIANLSTRQDLEVQ